MEPTPIPYDSRVDTLLHIKRVSQLMTMAAAELIRRSNCHDDSKLQEPEKSIFDEFTPKLKGSTYGSDEYKTFLKDMGVALEHHYENNSHHPEHYKVGIDGMDLFDLIEMVLDWKAAGERHANGNIQASLDINVKRFVIDEQLEHILRNTINRMQHNEDGQFTLFNPKKYESL